MELALKKLRQKDFSRTVIFLGFSPLRGDVKMAYYFKALTNLGEKPHAYVTIGHQWNHGESSTPVRPRRPYTKFLRTLFTRDNRVTQLNHFLSCTILIYGKEGLQAFMEQGFPDACTYELGSLDGVYTDEQKRVSENAEFLSQHGEEIQKFINKYSALDGGFNILESSI